MSQNPFESPKPTETKKEPTGGSLAYQHDGSGRTFVRQIGIVAGLMIAQGVLTSLFSIFCVGYSVMMMNFDAFDPGGELNDAFPAEQRQVLVLLFAVLAVVTFALSILYLIAGFKNYRLRGRGFGITTLLLGLCGVITCYCAPTGIALSIYGLIIYFKCRNRVFLF